MQNIFIFYQKLEDEDYNRVASWMAMALGLLKIPCKSRAGPRVLPSTFPATRSCWMYSLWSYVSQLQFIWGALMSHWKLKMVWFSFWFKPMETFLRTGLIQLKRCWIHVKWCLDDWWLSRFKRHRSLSTQTRHAAHGVPARPVQPAPPAPAPRPAARPASGGKWACSRRALRIWEFWKALQFAFWKESEL